LFCVGSGSGKSTIIRLLYRFFEPTSGQITVGGKAVDSVQLDSLRRQIAIVPQVQKQPVHIFLTNFANFFY
jgi:ABC-type multidrug transport system fused ATPase/permease subunit